MKTFSQTARIRGLLQASPGEWVSMPDLAVAGSGKSGGFCMVHSRIADLRKLGLTIENKTERDEDGTCMSYYRLIP
jgi:hypothetical protein